MSPESMRICMDGVKFGAETFSKWYLRGKMRTHLLIGSSEKDIRIMSGTDSIQRIREGSQGSLGLCLNLKPSSASSQAYLLY